MAGEWVETALADVIDFQEGPGILAKDFRDEGVPLVRLAGLERGNSLLAGCNYLDPQTVARKWAHFALAKGDVLLSASASLGRIAVVGDEGVGAIPYTGIIRMRPRDERLVASFIRYLLEGPDFQQQAEMVGAGSVIRHFGPMHLRQMSVRIPPPDEQRAIAHILGTLDDKIELNRRMNETLEEMARAIFKSWFVDFEPVRAKMEDRWRRGQSLPGLSARLYDLFPDRLVDSELGEIPEGWSVEPLDQIAHFLNGLALQKYPPEGDEYLPVIKIAELRKGVTASSGRASTKIPPQYVVEDGDVLFSWSGSLEVKLWAGGRGALNQHLFKVTSERYPKWFYYHWIKQHLPAFRVIAADKATTMGHIKRHHLTEALVTVPPDITLQKLGTAIKLLVNKILNNDLESRTLAAVRNTLLPKLISGELRVKDAEQIAGG